jgi:hypothetical protein
VRFQNSMSFVELAGLKYLLGVGFFVKFCFGPNIKDTAPPDFFLFRRVKDKVYSELPNPLDQF